MSSATSEPNAGIAEIAAPRLLLGLGVVLAGLAVLSMLIGPAGFGLPERAAGLILMEIRLPRTILAILVGAALGLSGAVLQGYLRNPLAEPGVIGVAGGAGLGAVLAIHSGASAAFALALPLGGLIGAALAMLAVLLLAGREGGALSLILSGVAVSSLAAALISGVLAISRNPFAAVEIVFWLLGSLADRSMTHVWLAAPFIVVGLVLMLAQGPALDALTLGEDVGRNLGVDPGRLQFGVVAGAAMSVGAATAVAGSIGFVGLVVPHVLRPFVGHRPSQLLPASLMGGAILLLAADIALRLITPAGELRLGVVTALLGTPFFLWLVARSRRELEP